MQTSKLNDWTQLLASIGVLVGIFLVFAEIRQNNEIAKAEAIAASYGMWESLSQIELQTDVNDLFIKSVEQPESLTDSEIMRLSSWLTNIISIYQQQTQLHQLDFTSDPNYNLEDAARFYFGGRFARAWFEANGPWIRSGTPLVYEVIRKGIDSTPVQTEFQYIESIKNRL